MALNPSPEFCLKLTYRYLLKAGHVPGETWGGVDFGSGGHKDLGQFPIQSAQILKACG